jgi:hypothetical protein
MGTCRWLLSWREQDNKAFSLNAGLIFNLNTAFIDNPGPFVAEWW